MCFGVRLRGYAPHRLTFEQLAPSGGIIKGSYENFMSRERGLARGHRSLVGHVLGSFLTSDKVFLLLVLPAMNRTSPVTVYVTTTLLPRNSEQNFFPLLVLLMTRINNVHPECLLLVELAADVLANISDLWPFSSLKGMFYQSVVKVTGDGTSSAMHKGLHIVGVQHN